MSKVKWTESDITKLKTLRDRGYTWDELTIHFKGLTPNALRKAYYRYLKSEVKTGPKVLLIDIETKPLTCYTWGLWDQNISLDMVLSDWEVLSWSAKWLGSSEIMYDDKRNDKDDKRIIKKIWSLMDEADIICGQNSKSFDIPKLNARFIKHKLPPPSSFRQIDTLKIAKKHFKFTSNKLEYMSEELCEKYKKLKHAEFPGFSLWKECLAGNPKAWSAMKEYNQFDVLALEELYNVLKKWDRSLDFSVYNDEVEDRCSCGSTEFKSHGFVFTNTAKYDRFICKDCGKEYRGTTNLLSPAKRKSLKK